MDLQYRSDQPEEDDDVRVVASVEIPVRPESVVLARAAIRDAARAAGLRDDCVDDLLIAGSEAVTNAMEAQLAAGVGTPLGVRLLVTSTTFAIEVVDLAGGGFDVAALAPRPPQTDPGHLDVERGWGIQLMRELVDRLEFDRQADGTTVRLVVGR
jgi:serine/threonine-protein kinase RsbW